MVADHKQQNWPASGNTPLKFPLKKWVNKLASYVHILRKEPGGRSYAWHVGNGQCTAAQQTWFLASQEQEFLKKMVPIFLKYIQGQIYAKSTQEYKM